jgi:type I restriction enzyme S subunit
MKADLYVDSGVPVLRGSNIGDSRGLTGDFVFVSNQTADGLLSANAFSDDLFFPHRGAIGLVGIVPADGHHRYMLGTSLMKLTCNRELLDPLYAFYWFRSPAGRAELLKNASTVGTPGIGQPLATLKQIRIPLPPLTEQRRIASMLAALDDKIELNRRMSQTLESMARALFKSWFVDFDPVRAKAEGHDCGLPTQLAELFPARLVDSDLGDIPERWTVKAFADTVEVIGGGTPKTSVPDYWDGDIAWFSVADAPVGSQPWVIDTQKKITPEGLASSSTRILPVGATIVSARGTVGRTALVGTPMAMNQSCYAVRARGGDHFFTYYTVRDLVASLQRRAHGSVFDTITRQTLADVKAIAPAVELVNSFENQVAPLMERMWQALGASRTLTMLRESLLPRLLAGHLPMACVAPPRDVVP